MKRKEISNFTEDERNWMNTVAVNYIIAQSDGFQIGYAQALSDFTECIIDYWESTDDKPQQSILDALVYLGVELGKRKSVAKENIDKAMEDGYSNYYNWDYKKNGEVFAGSVRLFTKDFDICSENGCNQEDITT